MINLTVFASVGVGLVALTLGTYVTINTLRQFKESVEEPLVDELVGEPTMNDLHPELPEMENNNNVQPQPEP